MPGAAAQRCLFAAVAASRGARIQAGRRQVTGFSPPGDCPEQRCASARVGPERHLAKTMIDESAGSAAVPTPGPGASTRAARQALARLFAPPRQVLPGRLSRRRVRLRVDATPGVWRGKACIGNMRPQLVRVGWRLDLALKRANEALGSSVGVDRLWCRVAGGVVVGVASADITMARCLARGSGVHMRKWADIRSGTWHEEESLCGRYR